MSAPTPSILTPSPREEILTKQELAIRLKVTVRTIEQWQRRGVLSPIKLGGVVRFYWPELIEQLRRYRVSKDPLRID